MFVDCVDEEHGRRFGGEEQHHKIVENVCDFKCILFAQLLMGSRTSYFSFSKRKLFNTDIIC